MTSITLTKHHGLGNDFLIAVEPKIEIGSDDARRWCERRRGIGADGLIVASRTGDDPWGWTMSLWNADGSRAELSGNGLRCLGQALILHYDDGTASPRYDITTDAGIRRVAVAPDRGSSTDQVTVEMGRPTTGPPPYPDWDLVGLQVQRQAGVDVGNPHVVTLVDRPDAIDLATIGPIVEGAYAGGVNVELIEIVDRSRINLRVWERGAGLTEACGSGACAAAWAARTWDLVDDRITVTMPGGDAIVDLVDGAAYLTGPATFVAIIEIEQGE